MTLRASFLILLIALIAPLLAAAQPSGPSLKQRLDAWQSDAQEIERALSDETKLGLGEVDDMRRKLDRQLDQIGPIQETLASQIAPLSQQLDALGPTPDGEAAPEAPELAAEREQLSRQIAELDALAKRADHAEVLANSLSQRLAKLRNELFTAQLIERGPSVLEPSTFSVGVDAIGRTLGLIWLETSARIAQRSVDAPLIVALLVPLALIAVVVVVLLRAKTIAVNYLASAVSPETPQAKRVAIGAALGLARFFLPFLAMLLLLGSIANSDLLGGQGEILLRGIGQAVMIVVAAYAFSGAFFAPKTPLLRPAILMECDAVASHRWTVLLAGVVALDHALVRKGEEVGLALEGLVLLNAVVLVLGGIALWSLMGYIRAPEAPGAEAGTEPAEASAAEPAEDAEADEAEAKATSDSVSLLRPAVTVTRLLARFVALASPLLALVGYNYAGRFVFYPLIYTIAVFGVCILLYYVVSSLVGWLARYDEHHSERTLTARLKLIPIAVGLLLGCAAFPVILLSWGAAPEDLAALWRQFVSGFQVGEIRIAPLDFLTLIAVVTIGLMLTDRLKGVLRRNVLPYTGLDHGARDALAAGAGYIGLIISALIAISVAGIDLSNIAIVAGALSVGIGFGLQNIVNNFVSGVILLIERPIKTGDWVEIAGTHGTVRKVNVRSTEIETFDRSAMFVPNSDLISGTVINWTHSNLNGRIIVKVGVAYDSDPRQVERILLEIAKAHPLMLRRPAPYVLFKSFGADALEFEIRGVLRDINWILNVQSDIHFELARRFSEEGIEVPFKQADIKLKNPQEIVDALRLLNAGRDDDPDSPKPREAKSTPKPDEAAGMDGD